MKDFLTTLKRERASDSVFQTLRDGILSQAFVPGERLNVKELAAKLGVSLTPVKDAINRLATEGLVEISPRSGTFVTEIAAEDVSETFEIRIALECLAAEKCLQRMKADDLRQFKEIIADLNKPMVTERDFAMHERRNVEFHTRIVELSGNRKLIEMYRSLNAHIKIARIHYSREGWENRMEQECAEHNEIFQALEKRDRDALVRAVRKHIERASQCLVEDLIRNGNSKKDSEKGEAK
jgi:DNA-binding GntR family transcriptional regulator